MKPIGKLIITETTTITTYEDQGLVFIDAHNDRLRIHNSVHEVLTGDAANKSMNNLAKVVENSTELCRAYFDSSLLSLLVQQLAYDEYLDQSKAPCVAVSMHQKDDKTPPYLHLEWCYNGNDEGDSIHIGYLMPVSGPFGKLARVHASAAPSSEQAEGSAE